MHCTVPSIIYYYGERESTYVQFRRKKEKKERTKQESHKVAFVDRFSHFL